MPVVSPLGRLLDINLNGLIGGHIAQIGHLGIHRRFHSIGDGSLAFLGRDVTFRGSLCLLDNFLSIVVRQKVRILLDLFHIAREELLYMRRNLVLGCRGVFLGENQGFRQSRIAYIV